LELVYLWVEDYKNIQEQGFNFSPKFNCHYNGKTLTIDENLDEEGNKKYIENFFGDNIKVTAIVGKNGSGKSSILELMSFLRFERLKRITDKSVYLVFQNKDKLYILNNIGLMHDFSSDIQIINRTNYLVKKESIDADELFELTMFTNSLYDFTMQDESFYILRTSHFYSFYNGEHLHYKEKSTDKNRHSELNAKYAFLLKDNDDFFSFLDEEFLFDSMYLEIDTIQKYEFGSNDREEEYIKEYEEINKIYNIDFGITSSWSSSEVNNIDENFKKDEIIYKFLSAYFLKEYLRVVERFSYDIKHESFKIHFLKKFFESFFFIVNDEKLRTIKIAIYIQILIKIREFFLELFSVIKKVFKSSPSIIEDFRQNTTILRYVTKYTLLSKMISKNFYLKDFEENKKNFLLISNNASINYLLLEKFYKHVDKSLFLRDLYNSDTIKWEFFNQVKSYNYRKLSTGEKQFLEFIVNFSYTIKKMNYTDKSIIFIEEIEISMHPEWQKKLFNIIINIFKKFNLLNHNSLKYHLIFTTHSPFLLSDIPKENVIFLNNGKNDKGINHKQTFGANIHTLLSDSFFMEDGLMGEFAKSKIDKAITLLNQDKLDEKDLKYCEQIISIIGEPIVKNQLQRRLDSKRLSKIDAISQKIKDMSYELKILKEHQSKIVQDELRDKGKKQYKQRFEDD
jgi:predicted ATP-binding protein involved in virulence